MNPTGNAVREPLKKALRELLYATRETRNNPLAPSSSSCGLGETSSLSAPQGTSSPFSPHDTAWAEVVAATGKKPSESLKARVGEWLEGQDRLDRERNHFLKAFRQKHGADRRAYPPETEREFEAGLDRLNAAEDLLLDDTAAALLEA
jgi:hypothetical protein